MVADVDTYFSLVNNYRAGEVAPFVLYLAKPRKGSADEKIIPWLLERPVVEAHSAAFVAGVEERSVYGALERLTAAGVITPITASRRNRAWAATEVFDEVDRLNKRLAAWETTA
jgi:hypothetical protein